MALRYGSIGNPKSFGPDLASTGRRHELIAIATAVAVLLVSFGCVRAQELATPKPSQVTLPRIEANRNLAPAGELAGGVLTVRLEIRDGEWYPEAETGPAVVVQALGEEGRALQIPGPLIRVPEGTEVRATVRNVLQKDTVRLYGLHGRPGDVREPLEISSGEIREVRFRLTAPGTYHYWATLGRSRRHGQPVGRRAHRRSAGSGRRGPRVRPGPLARTRRTRFLAADRPTICRDQWQGLALH